ncbi:MAG: hypothetical protein ACI4P6_03435 [Candidatus Spyradosoma sp.]
MFRRYCFRGDAPIYFSRRGALLGKEPSDPIPAPPSLIERRYLIPLKNRVDGATTPKDRRLENFIVMQKLFGGTAEKLAEKTHRGTLRVPAKRNKNLVALVGEKDERELRSDNVRFVFNRYLQISGKWLEIDYPTPLKNKKAAEQVKRVAQYAAFGDMLEKESEGKRLTQKEISEKIGVTQQRVQQIIAAPLYRELLRAVKDGLRYAVFGEGAKLDADEIAQQEELIPQRVDDELFFLYSPKIGKLFLLREFLLRLDAFGVATKKIVVSKKYK